MSTISDSQVQQILKAAGVDQSSLSFSEKADLAHALNFANAQSVQDALSGKNAGYATSILYRAGQSNSPGAQAIYSYLAKQMSPSVLAQGEDPSNAWQGKSHNFFVENPWLAPVAEIGAALVPGVGPEAAAAIDAAIGGISHANIGSGVKNPSNPLVGALEGAGMGYGANKLAGSLGIGGGSSGDLPPELDPTSPDYNPDALDPSSPNYDAALAQEIEKNPGILSGGGSTPLSSFGLGGGGAGLSAVDMARMGLVGLDALNATKEAGQADTLRSKALSNLNPNPTIEPVPLGAPNPYRSAQMTTPSPSPSPYALPPVPAGAPVSAVPAGQGPIAEPAAAAPTLGAAPSSWTPPAASAPKSPIDLATLLSLGRAPGGTATFGKLPLLSLLGGH